MNKKGSVHLISSRNLFQAERWRMKQSFEFVIDGVHARTRDVVIAVRRDEAKHGDVNHGLAGGLAAP